MPARSWPASTCRIADITAINGAVKDGKSMDEAVKDWIDSHADLLKRWENIKRVADGSGLAVRRVDRAAAA